jgi:hypothetical protein
MPLQFLELNKSLAEYIAADDVHQDDRHQNQPNEAKPSTQTVDQSLKGVNPTGLNVRGPHSSSAI